MIAKTKSILIKRFNDIIRSAEKNNEIIEKIVLVSEEENKLLYKWLARTGASIQEDGYTYKGIPIYVYEETQRKYHTIHVRVTVGPNSKYVTFTTTIKDVDSIMEIVKQSVGCEGVQ